MSNRQSPTSTLIAFASMVATFILPCSQAFSDVITTFDLENVCFSCPQTTATGSFTFDSTSDEILSAAIQTSAGNGYPSENYTSGIFLHDTSPGYPIWPTAQYAFWFTNGQSELILYTDTLSLTSPDALLPYGYGGGYTYGNEILLNLSGSRGLNEGQIDPTPLPAALPLFAGGLGAMGLLGWRRKRRAQAVA